MKSEDELLEAVAKLSTPQSSIDNSTPDLTERQVKNKWLAPYQWKKGESGNPGGRKKAPLTEALQWVMDLPYPLPLRAQLEQKFGIKLRKDLTFAQAIALGRSLGAVVDTGTADWIANRLEGALRQAVELSGPGGVPLPSPTLITQYVEMAPDGEPMRIIEVKPHTNGNNGADGTTEVPNPLPEDIPGT